MTNEIFVLIVKYVDSLIGVAALVVAFATVVMGRNMLRGVMDTIRSLQDRVTSENSDMRSRMLRNENDMQSRFTTKEFCTNNHQHTAVELIGLKESINSMSCKVDHLTEILLERGKP